MKWLLLAVFTLLSAGPASAQMPLLGYGTGSFVTAACGNCMTTPIMIGPNSGVPSNSATNYAGPIGALGGSNWNATLANRQMPIPTAGTISNLTVNFPTTIAAGAGSTCNSVVEPSPCYTVALMKAGTITGLFCNVFNGQQTCTDTTDVITVAAADLVNFEIIPVGTPTVQTISPQVSVTFTSTVGQESPIFGGSWNGNMGTAAVGYSSFGNTVAFNATETSASAVMPAAGVIDQLYARVNGVAGAGAGYDFKVFHGGTVTTLVCSISGASAVTCNDTNVGHAITVAQGDTLSIQACPWNTATCSAGSAPTARIGTVGVRWVPTTTNQALLLDVATTVPSATATSYLLASGATSNNATENTNFNVVPKGMTLSHLTESQGAAPGGATTRTITLRAGTGTQASVGSPGNVSCTVTSAATTCSDNTNSYAATAGNFVNLQTTVSATNAALVNFKLGMVVTVP